MKLLLCIVLYYFITRRYPTILVPQKISQSYWKLLLVQQMPCSLEEIIFKYTVAFSMTKKLTTKNYCHFYCKIKLPSFRISPSEFSIMPMISIRSSLIPFNKASQNLQFFWLCWNKCLEFAIAYHFWKISKNPLISRQYRK